jgi:hypothetical protein
MPTIVTPASHAQTESTVGFSYVFAGERIRQEITEKLDVVGKGLVVLYGDLQGAGSDTLRVTRFGGVGFAEQFTAMADETSPIVATGFTLGSDSITIGRYGLAKEQTYQDQILQRAETVGLDDMANLVPASLLATMRASVCTIGSTFATGAGAAAAAWTYDNELDLIRMFHETEGFESAVTDNGAPVAIRHPEQYTDLRASIRNEPGLQGSAELQMKLLGLQREEGGAFTFLGLRNLSSFDVPESGGGWVGCAYVPGAIGWAVASTIPITVENPDRTTWVPEYGIVIERRSTGDIATAKFVANAFFGLAKLDATLFPQFKITSIND